jgi:hypothetical protein
VEDETEGCTEIGAGGAGTPVEPVDVEEPRLCNTDWTVEGLTVCARTCIAVQPAKPAATASAMKAKRLRKVFFCMRTPPAVERRPLDDGYDTSDWRITPSAQPGAS